MNKIKTVFVVGRYKQNAIVTLNEFRMEFGDYISTYRQGHITLLNGVEIIAIAMEDEAKQLVGRTNWRRYSYDSFMEQCYRDAYYAAKKELEEIENERTSS